MNWIITPCTFNKSHRIATCSSGMPAFLLTYCFYLSHCQAVFLNNFYFQPHNQHTSFCPFQLLSSQLSDDVPGRRDVIRGGSGRADGETEVINALGDRRNHVDPSVRVDWLQQFLVWLVGALKQTTNIITFPFKRNGLPCCEDANTFRWK